MCPLCHRVIPGDDYNVAKDLAFCRACNESFSFADLMQGAELEAGLNLKQPPRGAWYRSDAMETVIGASLHSIPLALGSLAIALFWNGITSVFVCIAFSGTMRLAHIPLPEWFFSPKMNGHLMSLGEVLFLWLFLTPFILIGLAMISAVFLRICGKTELRVARDAGSIYTGLGPLGWSRKFDPRQVEAVRLVASRSNDSATRESIEISFRNRSPMKFGSMLFGERRKFVAGAATRMLKRG